MAEPTIQPNGFCTAHQLVNCPQCALALRRSQIESKVRRTYYGDPQDPVKELTGYSQQGAPREGDELCDGHQAHYIWRDGRWR